jgi:hypothetical protein
MPTLSTQQIGKCGELLVQYKLLLKGVESAHLTTDSGVDLVVYSANRKDAVTVQVKTNLQPKPGGGVGKLALDWWVTEDTPADLVAFVDLSFNRVWLMTAQEVASLAQQHSNGRHHLYMYVDPTYTPRNMERLGKVFEFERYLLDNRANEFF